MKKLLAKYWSMGFAFLFVGVLILALNKKSEATNSNPIMAQTSALKNANFASVFNQDAVAHAAGSVVIYSSATVATYPGLSVSTTTTANNPRIAGVVVGTLPASGWGIIQTYGMASVKIAVANSVGDPLATSTTAEQAGVETIAVSTTTVGADRAVLGIALETTTSSTTVRVMLHCE